MDVLGSEQNTTGSPRELVPEWVVVVIGSRQATSIREERRNLATFGVNFIENLVGTHVVSSRIYTTFVQHDHTGLFRLLIQGLEAVRGVGCGAKVLLVLDGKLSSFGVVDIRKHGDNEINLRVNKRRNSKQKRDSNRRQGHRT